MHEPVEPLTRRAALGCGLSVKRLINFIGKFPPFEHVVASLDSAFTAKEQNDPSGLTIWGVFQREGKRRIMLVSAWRKRLTASQEISRPFEGASVAVA